MSIYESSITNPKKQLEFYKNLFEQLQQENKQLKDNWKFLKKYVDSLWLDDKGIVTRLRERINLIESRNSNE